MSDTLSNIYPIPVEFVDGQQPTARFFNAWAEQIDEAFSLLSNVVGDFDGSGESEATFVPNLVRALGNQGWVGSRLPSGLRISAGGGPGNNLPFIEESLAAFEGQKEALLTFTPYPTEANGAGFTVTNLGTPVAKGLTVITSPLQNVASRVILDGRRLITNVPIPANASVIYPIDTGSESFAESMGPVTGANVIPSLQDIMRPAEGHPSTSYLCQLSKPGGYGPNEFKLTFPEVQDVINPLVPHSVDQSDVIKLRAMLSPVKWDLEDGRSAPRYRVPQIIIDVTTGNIIPTGLCALWYRGAPGVISRVRNPLDSSDITWELLASNNEIKITVPASLTLPSLHNEPGFASYIVAFAGTSIAEAVRHSTNTLISHSHDGRFGNQVDAFSLKGRFNPDEYTESQISHNHFPQYLLRGGYRPGLLFSDDPMNGFNAMLGNLLLGAVGATPESPAGAVDTGQDSHKILFSGLTGPNLFFDASDIENFTDGSLRKLRLDNAALRVDVGSIWLGEVTGDTNAVIVNSPREDDTPRVRIVGQSGETETNVEAGHFTTLHGRVIFGEDGAEVGSEIFYEEDTGDALFPYTWYLDNIDGSSEKTKLILGKVEAAQIIAETVISESTSTVIIPNITLDQVILDRLGEVQFVILMGQWILGKGTWAPPFAYPPAVGLGAIPIIAPYSQNTGDHADQELEVFAEIPTVPWSHPIEIPEAHSVELKSVSFKFSVLRNDADANASRVSLACGILRCLQDSGYGTTILEEINLDSTDALFPGGGGLRMMVDTTVALTPQEATLPSVVPYKYFAAFKIGRKSFTREETFALNGITVTYEVVED